LVPILSGQAGYAMDWMYRATEENQKQFIDRFLELGINIDHWWMDTGWYYTQGVPDAELTEPFRQRKNQDTLWEVFNVWEYNHGRFPRGIRAVSDYAHDKGIKTILWFEPERVTPGSWQHKAHPEWCLRASSTDQMLLNLGQADALQWATDRISQVIQEQGVDVFRSDFNMDPLDHWRQNDIADRQGITENHWVRGYLAFWDGLFARHPGLLIDSCASGGRRNDLETMRRAVPLWKCDYAIEPVGMQCQTYGLAMWIPYFGNAGGQMDPYVFRSNMFPAITKGAWEDRSPRHDIRQNQDYGPLRRMIDQWRRVAPYYLGDYYPLTPYSLEKSNVWIAWQFQALNAAEGVVHAYRRPGSQRMPSQSFKLRGLDGSVKYEVTNLDDISVQLVAGHELMENGLTVVLREAPAAAVVVYKKAGFSD
jgi:alpha-galactosidase